VCARAAALLQREVEGKMAARFLNPPFALASSHRPQGSHGASLPLSGEEELEQLWSQQGSAVKQEFGYPLQHCN